MQRLMRNFKRPVASSSNRFLAIALTPRQSARQKRLSRTTWDQRSFLSWLSIEMAMALLRFRSFDEIIFLVFLNLVDGSTHEGS